MEQHKGQHNECAECALWELTSPNRHRDTLTSEAGRETAEFDRLRAVNAKLLTALEYTTAFLSGIIEGERIPTGIKASARVQIDIARAAIEEAKK